MQEDNHSNHQEPRKEERKVNTYDPNDLFKKPTNRGFSGWKKGLLIFLIVVVAVVGLSVGCNMGVRELFTAYEDEESYEYSDDYIGVLEVKGTMSEDSDSSSTYNQQWLLKRIEQMKSDPQNRGMILSVDTPGGSVYAIDELYLKIKEYEEETGRPVYAYMGSMAASGGYYISAGTDKIYANRNCWTGSIGVTIGTIYDLSELLEKMGVKTVTITSGDNKAMGSSVEPLTKEQKEIYQSLVDEAYEQFIAVVAEGRDMKVSKAKKLGDGRVYTAKQAKANGLVDEIGTLEDAAADMMRTYELEDCELQHMRYKPSISVLDLFMETLSDDGSEAESEYDQLKELIEDNSTFTVTYMSQIKK